MKAPLDRRLRLNVASLVLGPFLTQAEIADLPDGELVVVKWSGGNGPWCYEIQRDPFNLKVCAVSRNFNDVIYQYEPLVFVGSEKFHTRVRRILKGVDMKPANKLRFLVLRECARWERSIVLPSLDDAAIEAAFNSDVDAENEIRGGTVETGLPCPSSRHYEGKSVATQFVDGSWVGWTYWYGGGKFGCAEDVPWIEDAYDLECTEETRVVRTFRRAQ